MLHHTSACTTVLRSRLHEMPMKNNNRFCSRVARVVKQNQTSNFTPSLFTTAVYVSFELLTNESFASGSWVSFFLSVKRYLERSVPMATMVRSYA